jgi:hypothetical protein
MRISRFRPFAACCLSIAALLACEDNAKRAVTGDPLVRDMDAPIGGNVIEGGVMVTPDMMVMEDPPKAARELRAEGATTRTIFLNEQLQLSVRYITVEAGAEVGIANQAVTLTLLDAANMDRTAAGVDGSRLQSSRVNTNAMGLATLTLFAGGTETSLKIKAEAPDAPPVYFTVSVVRPGTGDLVVRVRYDVQSGRYNFQQLDSASVALFSGRQCAQIIGDATRLSGAYFAWNPIQPFNEVMNSVSAGDFAHDAVFTVAASARNVNGQAIAFGCVEDVRIVGGQTTEVDIDAVDLPLDFKGRFVTTNRFDLTDLLRSSGNPSLNIVVDVLDILGEIGSDNPDRGRALVAEICDLVVSNNLVDVDCGLINTFGTILNPAIIGLLNQIPENVMRVFVVISDVLAIATELTVVGEMNFRNDPDQDNMVREVNNSWQRFRFDWRNGCPMPGSCTREFTIGNLDRDARPITGAFDAQVDGETLNIFEHGMTFRYGLIVLGLAEQWLLPAILNRPLGQAVTLRELLSNAFANGCQQIDNAIGQPGFCNNVLVTALSALLEDQLTRLEFSPEQFRMEGHATLVDTNIDLLIDQLQDGVWLGHITTPDINFEFNGCFNACRDQECGAPLNECVIPEFMP